MFAKSVIEQMHEKKHKIEKIKREIAQVQMIIMAQKGLYGPGNQAQADSISLNKNLSLRMKSAVGSGLLSQEHGGKALGSGAI